jgi:hypothetical protein
LKVVRKVDSKDFRLDIKMVEQLDLEKGYWLALRTEVLTAGKLVDCWVF